jgi:hypothetical protein
MLMDEYQLVEFPLHWGTASCVDSVKAALKIQRQGTLADGSFQSQEINLSVLAWPAATYGAKDRNAIKSDDTRKKTYLLNSFCR